MSDPTYSLRKPADDLRMIAHVRLETGDGEQILELNLNELFPMVFADFESWADEAIIANCFARTLIAPIRCVIRSRLSELRKMHEPLINRLDRPGKLTEWKDEPDEKTDSGEEVMRFYRERRLEEVS